MLFQVSVFNLNFSVFVFASMTQNTLVSISGLKVMIKNLEALK